MRSNELQASWVEAVSCALRYMAFRCGSEVLVHWSATARRHRAHNVSWLELRTRRLMVMIDWFRNRACQ